MKRIQSARYDGTCYIGVVGPENEIGECRDSIEAIERRNYDSRIIPCRATKGYEARQQHLNNFIQSKHDFILLLDHDMIFPPDTLERLRSYRLPFVSGYYLRRRYQPIAPVWFEYPKVNRLPYKPMVYDPECTAVDPATGQTLPRLHKLGASGWGCILVHREVVLAVQEILKGEDEVIEDDMDVWPYDLGAVMKAISALEGLAEAKHKPEVLYPALREHVGTLRKEIRVLRGVKDAMGSDLRFAFFAREAGYTLYGDPGVRCGHSLNYPLHPDDFTGHVGADKEEYIKLVKDNDAGWKQEAKRVRDAIKAVTE